MIQYLAVWAKVFQGALLSLAGERVPSKKARLRQLVQPRTREPGWIAFTESNQNSNSLVHAARIQVLLFATLTPDCQLGHLQQYERPLKITHQ